MGRKMICLMLAVCMLTGCSQQPRIKTTPVTEQTAAVGMGGTKTDIEPKTWGYRSPDCTEEKEKATFDNVEFDIHYSIPDGLKEEYVTPLKTMEKSEFEKLAKRYMEKYQIQQDHLTREIWCHINLYGTYANVECFLTTVDKETGLYAETYPTMFCNAIYDIYTDRILALSELFVDGTNYMSLINEGILKAMRKETRWGMDEIDQLKRPFTGLKPNEFDFCFSNMLAEKYTPFFEVQIKENNRFFRDNTIFWIECNDFENTLTVNPEDMLKILDNPDLDGVHGLRTMYQWENIVQFEHDTSIKHECISNMNMFRIKEIRGNDIAKDQINAVLSRYNQKFIDDFVQDQKDMQADLSDIRTDMYTTYGVVGPFISLEIFIRNGDVSLNRNLTFHLANGKLMRVKDLLRPKAFKELTSQQTAFLEDTNFVIDSSGNITVHSQGDHVNYPSTLFDFDRYSTYEIQKSSLKGE